MSFFALWQNAQLEGPALLSALLVCFLGGALVAQFWLRGNARALYRLIRKPETDPAPKKEPEE